MSKGSSPRPFAVSNEEYSNRWDAIFGRDNEKKNEEKALESFGSDSSCGGGGGNNTPSNSGQTQVS